MSNIVFATPELSDAATITASSAVSGAPIDNVQRMQPKDIWQSSNLLPYIEIDLGAANTFNLIALLFTNSTQYCNWRIRAATSQANLISSPGYDSGYESFSAWDTQADRRHGFKLLSSSITYRWVRIDLSDIANTDGVFSVGRLYVSNAYQPALNHKYGNAIGFKDTSPRDRMSSGELIANRQAVVPFIEILIDTNDEDEYYANLYQIEQLRGGSRDVLVITDPADATNGHEKIYYGLLQLRLRTELPRYRKWTRKYVLEGMV